MVPLHIVCSEKRVTRRTLAKLKNYETSIWNTTIIWCNKCTDLSKVKPIYFINSYQRSRSVSVILIANFFLLLITLTSVLDFRLLCTSFKVPSKRSKNSDCTSYNCIVPVLVSGHFLRWCSSCWASWFGIGDWSSCTCRRCFFWFRTLRTFNSWSVTFRDNYIRVSSKLSSHTESGIDGSYHNVRGLNMSQNGSWKDGLTWYKLKLPTIQIDFNWNGYLMY